MARLPFVPQLYDGEMLSSWLDRFCLHYGLSRFAVERCLPAGARDLKNLSTCDQSLAALSAFTGLPKADFARARLSAYVQPRKDHDVRPILGNEKTPSFCVSCLGQDWEEGRDAHFRIAWSIAGVGHCHLHGELLHHAPLCCWGEREPQLSLVDGRVRLHCRGCLIPIGRRAGSSRALEPHQGEFHQLTYAAEELLAKAVLKGECDWAKEVVGCTASQFVRLIDDIAFFLYSPDDRSLPSHLWGFPIWQLSNALEHWPLLRPGSGCADAFPLDHDHPMTRFARLQACMLVLFPYVAIRTNHVRWMPEPLPSISWLYRCFTPGGKRLFTQKARSWPERIVVPLIDGSSKRARTFWQARVRSLVPSLARSAERHVVQRVLSEADAATDRTSSEA